MGKIELCDYMGNGADALQTFLTNINNNDKECVFRFFGTHVQREGFPSSALSAISLLITNDTEQEVFVSSTPYSPTGPKTIHLVLSKELFIHLMHPSSCRALVMLCLIASRVMDIYCLKLGNNHVLISL